MLDDYLHLLGKPSGGISRSSPNNGRKLVQKLTAGYCHDPMGWTNIRPLYGGRLGNSFDRSCSSVASSCLGSCVFAIVEHSGKKALGSPHPQWEKNHENHIQG